MTLQGLIDQCWVVAAANPGSLSMDVVFHDVDGSSSYAVDICVDGTCNENEDVVRVTLIDSDDAPESE